MRPGLGWNYATRVLSSCLSPGCTAIPRSSGSSTPAGTRPFPLETSPLRHSCHRSLPGSPIAPSAVSTSVPAHGPLDRPAGERSGWSPGRLRCGPLFAGAPAPGPRLGFAKVGWRLRTRRRGETHQGRRVQSRLRGKFIPTTSFSCLPTRRGSGILT